MTTKDMTTKDMTKKDMTKKDINIMQKLKDFYII